MQQELLLVPLIIGLVQVVKEIGLPSRLAPLLSIAVGQALALYMGIDLVQALVYSLSASGLWSGAKATVGN